MGLVPSEPSWVSNGLKWLYLALTEPENHVTVPLGNENYVTEKNALVRGSYDPSGFLIKSGS